MWTTTLNRRVLRVRGMMHDDLREVLAIEAEAFVHPWSESDFVEHLEDFESVGLVVECEGTVAAYLVFGFDGRDIEICSCVVAEPFRRQGIGTLMVQRLTKALSQRSWDRLSARVPERNLGALFFFQRCGFKAVAVLPQYLVNGQDVYVMEYTISNTVETHCPEQDELIPFWAVKHG